MPLLGAAAMLLSFDIDAPAVDEHDDWHTHEHLPERLSIPGFLRGTRWRAASDGPGYMVVYEVSDLAVLGSEAYLQRLNHPTPWTSKMMPHYRGMRRGLCAVRGSFGLGDGYAAALVRFRAAQPDAIHAWLLADVLPALPQHPGLGSAHLLEGAAQAAMTAEQRIRGADAGVDTAIIVTGYDAASVAGLAQGELAADRLAAHGAEEVSFVSYRLDYSLSHSELGA